MGIFSMGKDQSVPSAEQIENFVAGRADRVQRYGEHDAADPSDCTSCLAFDADMRAREANGR